LLDDLQLVDLVKNGNTDAFGQIIERYQLFIAKYLYRLTGEYETARDLTQDTFVAAFQNLRKNNNPIILKAWLYGIATNKALQYRRRKKIIIFIPFSDYKKSDPPDNHNRIEELPEKMAIQTALLKIPKEQRVCMVLHFVEGFKYREIAQTLGISEDAVRMRVARGSREFRKQYGPKEGDVR
jgi:RNA polymerase sigma-70 factor (ECF subfamily)